MIRNAAESDKLELKALDFTLYGENYSGFDIYNDIQIKVIKGKIIGYIVSNRGCMMRIGVHPDYQRKGFGTNLLSYANIHTANVPEYFVSVQMFLKSLKFTCVESIKHGLGKGRGYLFKKDVPCS